MEFQRNINEGPINVLPKKWRWPALTQTNLLHCSLFQNPCQVSRWTHMLQTWLLDHLEPDWDRNSKMQIEHWDAVKSGHISSVQVYFTVKYYWIYNEDSTILIWHWVQQLWSAHLHKLYTPFLSLQRMWYCTIDMNC